jgi:hypothetical protein
MPIEWPWKRWARERREGEEYLRWLTDQQRALESGEEIKPPWIVWPGEEPWWGRLASGKRRAVASIAFKKKIYHFSFVILDFRFVIKETRSVLFFQWQI